MESTDRLTISLVPESGDPTDSRWQDECLGLVNMLRADSELEVKPATRRSGDPSARALDLRAFQDITVTVLGSATVGAAAPRIFDALSTWLKRRHGCQCVIRTADGSEFVFNNLSRDEALRMLASHLRSTSREAPRH